MKPTYIYWLLDSTVPGWPQGEPFYCGKTTRPLHKRLREHLCLARVKPWRELSARIHEAGERNVKILQMAIVEPDQDWREVESRWIRQLKHTNRNGRCVNLTSGGEGTEHSSEQRRIWSVMKRGRPKDYNHSRRISIALKEYWATTGAHRRRKQKPVVTKEKVFFFVIPEAPRKQRNPVFDMPRGKMTKRQFAVYRAGLVERRAKVKAQLKHGV